MATPQISNAQPPAYVAQSNHYNFVYTPDKTLGEFMASDARVRALRGPVGSGKTSACIMELLRRAGEQAPGPDGIRRSRGVIVRNTLSQLKSTCLESIRTLLGPVMNYRVSDHTVQIRAGDIEADWLLLPLDTPENVQRLLSLEVTYAWVSEFREIDTQIAMDVYSRCGRYPSKAIVAPTWYGLVMETNSFSEDSPWNERLELNKPEGWDYFVQPSALSPDAENIDNLPETYYEDMVNNNTPEWVEQYVENKITPSLSGQAVYKSAWVDDFHISSERLNPTRGYPLIIGCDFARWPAAVICQLGVDGGLRVFQEFEMENTGVEKFINEKIIPSLMNDERFRGMSAYIIGDPSGVAKGEIGEESVFDMLKRLGLSAMPAMTNNIAPRIRAVEKFLLGQRGGKAALRIDPYGCPLLIRGFRSEYRYKKKKTTGIIESKPDKDNRPFADLHDALQYACLGTARNMIGRVMRVREEPTPPPPDAGWT